jgi:hypothetical protein
MYYAGSYTINSGGNNTLSYIDDDGIEMMGIAGTLKY